jgi:gluconokinase
VVGYAPGVAVVLLMGVSGSGKSTIGVALAHRLGWLFVDADSLHSPASVAKMAAGIPLDDADRAPWLRTVADWIAARRAAGQPAIVACSALKRAYRDLLRTADPDLRVVHLRGTRDELEARLAQRRGHFFPAALLDAQLADLEPPGPDENAIDVHIGASVGETVESVLRGLEAPTR